MLYYSHVNEDNRVERNLLKLSTCSTVVAVAGSGERVIALMDDEKCTDYHVVDPNREALYLLQLKLAALQTLYVQEYLEFIGHLPASKEKRSEWFGRFQHNLPPACHSYWVNKNPMIEKGVLQIGHFENFIRRVRKPVNFFLGNKFQQVFSSYDRKNFPSAKWKMICRIFSIRWIYKAYGNKDQAFTGEKAVTKHIPSALTRTIESNKSAASIMMHLVFKGHLRNMKENDLPPSLNRIVLSRIKQRLSEGSLRLQYHETDLLSFVKTTNNNKGFIFYSVSDLLSFVSNEYMDELLEKASGTNNIIVWRAFLRNRPAKNSSQGKTLPADYELKTLSDIESTGMYQVFALQNQHAHELA